MPENIKVDDETGIIEVLSYGKVTKGDIAESIKHIYHIQEDKGFNKVFVDATGLETMPSISGIYELFSNLSREIRLAVLAHESQTTANDISFVETVGINRGVRVKIFKQKDKALQWLSNKR